MNLAKLTHRRRVAGKRMAFEVKATLEAARPVASRPGADIRLRYRRGGYRFSGDLVEDGNQQ